MSIRRVEKVVNLIKVKNAFITVSEKVGLDKVIATLVKHNPDVVIFASSGTYNYIKNVLGEEAAEKNLVEVSTYTGQPEIAGGLVKTLHHKMFLGYLTETDCEDHQQALSREKAVPIDLVIGDLYPFADVIAKEGADLEDARGNIDVGGPAALRASAKNFLRVMTTPGPAYYDELIAVLETYNGHTSLEARFYSAKNTWDLLTDYDCAIYNYFESLGELSLKKTYTIS